MRTKVIKISDKDVECILMAGLGGARLYLAPSISSIALVKGKVKHVFQEGSKEFDICLQYANLKYQPISLVDTVKQNFINLIGGDL